MGLFFINKLTEYTGTEEKKDVEKRNFQFFHNILHNFVAVRCTVTNVK